MRCIELRHYSRVPVPTSWQRISEPSAKTYKAAATAFLANTDILVAARPKIAISPRLQISYATTSTRRRSP